MAGRIIWHVATYCYPGNGIKTRSNVNTIHRVGSNAKAYLSGFVEEALNETMEKTPVK
jgi:hypothetical protein